MAKKKFLFEWRKFWTNELISATVENGAKANIVCTFNSIKPFNRAVKEEFTSTSTIRTCSSITKDASAKTITCTMNSAYANGNTINLVFNPTKKGKTVTQSVTNNIPA